MIDRMLVQKQISPTILVHEHVDFLKEISKIEQRLRNAQGKKVIVHNRRAQDTQEKKPKVDPLKAQIQAIEDDTKKMQDEIER